MGLQHLPGQLIVDRCVRLARVTAEPGRTTRAFATPAMTEATTLVGGWMAQAGLAVRTDAMGNLVGRVAGTDPAAGTLLLGSHLDTVRDAGAFDGPLGVLTGIACAQRLGGRVPFALEVLGFADEEGLRFGTAFLGSRALLGRVDAGLLALMDDDGVTIAGALRAAGLDPARVGEADRRGEHLRGYLEVHLEQGPVLEARGAPVGVVSAIAGHTRAEVTFTGVAGHAGTLPMTGRRDAVAGLAELVLAVEELGRATPGARATVGRITAVPGAANVVAGAAVATVDVRHARDEHRVATVAAIRARAEAIAAARGLGVAWQGLIDEPATAVDPGLTAALAAAAQDVTGADVRLLSGAGHDAMVLAGLTGVALLFVRCRGGVSHHPDEHVSAADAGVALEVLCRAVEALAC